MMQNGVDIWQASKFLGMTVQTLESTYGHHRPDYLESAKAAFSRSPAQRANDMPTISANRKRTKRD
jgi:hypothetical protein